MKAAYTIVVSKVVDGDDVYFSAFDAETGDKIAPWSDSDTPEQVLDKICQRPAT